MSVAEAAGYAVPDTTAGTATISGPFETFSVTGVPGLTAWGGGSWWTTVPFGAGLKTWVTTGSGRPAAWMACWAAARALPSTGGTWRRSGPLLTVRRTVDPRNPKGPTLKGGRAPITVPAGTVSSNAMPTRLCSLASRSLATASACLSPVTLGTGRSITAPAPTTSTRSRATRSGQRRRRRRRSGDSIVSCVSVTTIDVISEASSDRGGASGRELAASARAVRIAAADAYRAAGSRSVLIATTASSGAASGTSTDGAGTRPVRCSCRTWATLPSKGGAPHSSS